MYCKSCNSLLNEDSKICPKCGFDNNNDLEETTEIYLNKIANPRENKNKRHTATLIVFLIFLVAILIVFLYIIKDNSNEEGNVVITTTTTTTTTSNIKKFKFNGIQVEYPKDTYGTLTDTIFLKEDNSIYITFNTISEEEYNEYINTNDVLDDTLGEISTKTFASDNSYSHIFTVNNTYYLIEVNYKDSTTSENIQLELSKIIKSLSIISK